MTTGSVSSTDKKKEKGKDGFFYQTVSARKSRRGSIFDVGL